MHARACLFLAAALPSHHPLTHMHACTLVTHICLFSLSTARQELCSLAGSLTRVTELMRAPALIPDARLRREVEECIERDRDFSPGADRISRSVGACLFVCLCVSCRVCVFCIIDGDGR